MIDYMGTPVIVSASAVTGPYEDWSRVRSPGRARRRMRRGYLQNVRVWYKPAMFMDKARRTIIAHPAMVEAMKREVAGHHEAMRLAAVEFGYDPA